MAIKVVVGKALLHDVQEGIDRHPAGGIVVAVRTHIQGFGHANVAIQIEGDTFNQLAQAMMDANANEAIKAFGAALQAGIERHPGTAKDSG
jgi:hypothetical protein